MPRSIHSRETKLPPEQTRATQARGGRQRPPASLRLRDVRRSFGDLVAVDRLSFSVPAGRLFGFVGRNGAGKTTTMRIICGLLAAETGSVSWNGGPIDARVRERIGYMPEERGLYPKMRLGDHLEYLAVLHGASHARGRAAASAWLERLGLGDRMGARVEELSHGNQQRVQLAAALVALEILATCGMVALAARAYERAILRIGAPLKLRRLFAARLPQTHRHGRARLSAVADIALRAVALVLVLAGAGIGFAHPVAIALAAIGLLLLIVEQTFKHRPHNPAR